MAYVNSTIDYEIDISANEWFESASDEERVEMRKLCFNQESLKLDADCLYNIKNALECLWLNGDSVDTYTLKEIEYIINKLKED